MSGSPLLLLMGYTAPLVPYTPPLPLVASAGSFRDGVSWAIDVSWDASPYTRPGTIMRVYLGPSSDPNDASLIGTVDADIGNAEIGGINGSIDPTGMWVFLEAFLDSSYGLSDPYQLGNAQYYDLVDYAESSLVRSTGRAAVVGDAGRTLTIQGGDGGQVPGDYLINATVPTGGFDWWELDGYVATGVGHAYGYLSPL